MWFNVVIDVMKAVVGTEVKKYAENKVISKIIKWYKTYKNIREKIGRVKHIYNLVVNPNNWLKALQNLPKSEINSFLKELNNWRRFYNEPQFKNNERYIYEDEAETVGMETNPETQAFRINKAKFDKAMNELNQEMSGKGKWVDLSSSWLKRGMYKMIFKDKMLGALSIETKTSETIYVYPLVPYDVWIMMKEANGMNGGGAGTQFWKYWLHKWMPSALRRKIKNDFHNKQIGKDEYNIAMEQANKSANAWIRSNSAKNEKGALNREWYDQQGGKGFRPGRYDTYTNLYQKVSEEMYIKPASYGFTTIVHNYKRKRNPYYINKREQGKIRKQARKTAKEQSASTLYNRTKRAKRNVNRASHPLRTTRNVVKKNIIKGIRKWGK